MRHLRLFAISTAAVFSLSMLTACAPKQPAALAASAPAASPPAVQVEYKDGTYKAKYDRNDIRNWNAFVEITVKGGKIASAVYDYTNGKGETRSDNKGYEEGFKGINGFTPKEAFKRLTDSLIKVQTADAVEAVTGATHSTKNFKELAAAALENAKNGGSTEAVVNLYRDGVYKVAFDKFDSHGWKAQLELEIKDHNIANVNFDYLNKEGKLKTQDAGYKTAMEAKSKTYPEKYTTELEQQLLSKQILGTVDAITGATASSENFKALAEVALDDMAEKGETTPKTIPVPKE